MIKNSANQQQASSNWSIRALLSMLSPLLLPLSAKADVDAPGFLQPGAIYREYVVNHRLGDDWRVTDPGVTRSDARAFLPNAEFTIDGLSTEGITHADFTLSHWLGHEGTGGQVFFFNDSAPINIPLDTPYSLRHRSIPLNMDNPEFDIPVELLKAESNTYRGSIADNYQGAHWWGQWGWYAAFLRTYLGPATPHPLARITNISDGAVLQENPEIVVELESEAGIRKVEIFARYYGYDENGDYIFDDWHYFFHQHLGPEGHVATITPQDPQQASVSVTWNTEWIPDQDPRAVALVARVQDLNGIYSVTEVVNGLSLHRGKTSVKLFVSGIIPTKLIRANTEAEIDIRIPQDYPVGEALAVRMPVRTWNGANNEIGYTPLRINNSNTLQVIRGDNHYYKMESPEIDPALLVPGSNSFLLTSSTEHHGCEILLPGPAFLIKWDQALPRYIDGSRTPARAGWYSGWFSHFYYTPGSRWVYSYTLGWLYWNRPSKIDQRYGWFYAAGYGWIFLSEELLPFINSFTIAEWIQFQDIWKP